jgi:hypothetical protein
MNTSNHPSQQDALKYLEDQVCSCHAHCETAQNTALSHALSAGDLLLAVTERYPKHQYGGRMALYARTCGSAKTGRTYVFLAKHRDLLEEGEKNRPSSADFDGHSIASALEYIRKRKRALNVPESEAPAPAEPAATASSPQPITAGRDDIGADSRAEADRLRTRIEEQGHEIRRLKELVTRLENRLEADPTPAQLQVLIKKLGLPRFRLEVLPPDWIKPLTDAATSLAKIEQLIAALEHKIPVANKTARKHLRTLEVAVNQPPTITGTCEAVLH